jgi:hypothetical protein
MTTVRQQPFLQELNPNTLLALRRRRQTLTDVSTDKPALQRRCVVCELSVVILKTRQSTRQLTCQSTL